MISIDMIDSSGNITLDRAADEFIPFSWVDDETNAQIDISQSNLTFIVQNGFTIVPGLDPSNASGRLLHFTEEHAQSLGKKDRSYVLMLREGDIDTALLRGTIKAEGFIA
jgi:hypothetical protein